MSAAGCAFEADVLAAIGEGRWPQSVPRELRDHAAACAPCSDLAEAASAVREAFDAAKAGAQLPAPGLVWWRAQTRMRRAAAASTRRRSVAAETAAVTLFAALAVLALVPIIAVNPGILVRAIEIAHGALPWLAVVGGVAAALAIVPVLGLRSR